MLSQCSLSTRLKEELSQLGLPAFASAQLLEGKMERGAACHTVKISCCFFGFFEGVPAV